MGKDDANANANEDAFGVHKIKAPEVPLKPNFGRLRQAMNSQDSFIRCFCSSCGHYFELTEDGVREVASGQGFDLPNDPNTSYILFSSCATCKSSRDEPVKVISFGSQE